MLENYVHIQFICVSMQHNYVEYCINMLHNEINNLWCQIQVLVCKTWKNIDLDKSWLRVQCMSTFIIIILHVNIKLHINIMIMQFDIIYLAGGEICHNSPHPDSNYKTVNIRFQNKRDRILDTHKKKNPLCMVKKSLALEQRILFYIV